MANAKTACAAGDVPTAIRLLAELYTESNDPIWVFNQGRCYHQNNLLSQAEARFKEFLRKNSNGPAEDSREAQNYIDEIEAELRKAEAAKAATVPPPPMVASPPLLVESSRNETPDSPEKRRLRRAGLGCLVFGGVSVAAGVAFTLLMRRAQGDVEDQTKDGPVPYAAVSNRFSDGKMYSTLQWFGYGIGAGALVTGTVLYYLGARKPASSPQSASLQPLLLPGGAGALLQATF